MPLQYINQLYNVSSPPPRTIFSSHSPSRFRFPDFNDPSYRLKNGLESPSPAFSARVFIKSLFYFGSNWSRSTFIQFKILAALAVCLFFLFCWVLVRRIQKKTFWILRLIKRSNGNLIAPNSTVGFTFFEGIYALILIAFFFEFCGLENGKLPKGTMLWALLTWSPLITGAWFGLIGTVFAMPKKNVKSKTLLKALWKAFLSPRPLVINLLCLFIPIVQQATIIIPAIISNSHFYKGLRRWQVWDSKYSTETELSHEMLQEALEIWKIAVDGYYFLAIGFLMWAFWAILLSVAYGGCGISLLKTISDQIKSLNQAGVEDASHYGSPSSSPLTPAIPLTPFSASSKTLLGSPLPKTPCLDPKWQNEALVSSRLDRNGSLGSNYEKKDVDLYTTPNLKSDRQSLRSLSKIETNSRTALRLDLEGEDDDDSTNEMHRQERHNPDLIFSERELVEDLPHKSFFPAMRPSAFDSLRRQQNPTIHANKNWITWNCLGRKPRGEKAGKSKKSEVHARFLEKVYYNFLVNFGAKFGGEMAFSGVALFVTVKICASAETNDVASPIQFAMLYAGYASILFGSLTLGAIAQRSYEPATQAYLLVLEQNQAKRSTQFAQDWKRSPSLPRLARKVSHKISLIPRGSLAERRIKRGRNRGLGIDAEDKDEEIPFPASRPNASNNPLLIQQTVEQIIDLDSFSDPVVPSPKSPSGVSSASTLRNGHSRFDSSSTAYSSNENFSPKRSTSSVRNLSKSPSRAIEILPQSKEDEEVEEDGESFSEPSWSPFPFPISSIPQSPYFDIPSPSPIPNQVNSNRAFGPFESLVDMEENHVETTFPSASPLINSPARSVQRKDSSNSVLSSLRSAWRPQPPSRSASYSSMDRIEVRPSTEEKLSWTAPTEWGSPSPDMELIAEQERSRQDRKR